ncbi:nucleoside kinase [Proteiniclasticum sp.]|uniref:nucleoside kinase n=1 Tax=Proteiniclasticum sp. TaxID=2053595 RepID=UPI00289C5B2B|nr:nucleoside kinase [Proteiniclasticum sp.]
MNDRYEAAAIEEGVPYEVVKTLKKGNLWPILARERGEYFELNGELTGKNNLIPVYTDDYVGHKAYERTLSFILVTAFYRLFRELDLIIDHSISRGLYCWIRNRVLSQEEMNHLEEEMRRIIKEDYPITKECMLLEDALAMYKESQDMDKYLLLKNMEYKEIKMYRLLDQYAYFYGKMAVSTGNIRLFSLDLYKNGFVMSYPTVREPEILRPFEPQDKLFKIFEETARWDELIGVNYVGYLNEKIRNHESRTLINITEALHEKKIAYIADDIKERGNVKIVLIAGPSSSGKTSFANRLAIQLRVNGLIPFPISMDDYFVPRRMTPKKADGSFDFESVEAIELDLFEQDITNILKGEEVILPKFDFKTGTRGVSLNMVKLPENGIIIIEGIHGLNPRLLGRIEDRFKFKIYISALTVLNMDKHNRIATTDVRKLRRMARDHISRGYSPEDTLLMFPSVSSGEKMNIFPYQEEADAMFNSTLFYELSVLKKHTLPELMKITKDSPTYEEAKRLITILRLFEDTPDELVPTNSLLREFIGGSQFYDY